MNATLEPLKEEKGLSAHQLILMFLAAVAVCAVFFSAGFLVGYNERGAKSPPAAERVSASSSVIPPVVNSEPVEATTKTAEPTVTEGKPELISPEPLKAPPFPPLKPRKKPGAAAKTAAPKAAPAEPSAAAKRFEIQVAASNTEAVAEKIATALKGEGFPAFIAQPRFSRPGDDLYRVEVGPYATREQAQKVLDKLAKAGIKQPFIKH